MSNNIVTIRPYKLNKMWVFDDARVGLCEEALVCGVPEVLEGLCALAQIPLEEAEKGFNLMFSKNPIPNYQLKVTRVSGVRENPDKIAGVHIGNWYRVDEPAVMGGMEGWLCPALFKYFDEAPDVMYVKV